MIHTEARGGTPYGASTIAGPKGELEPKSEDLQLAEALGKRVAEIALKVRPRNSHPPGNDGAWFACALE